MRKFKPTSLFKPRLLVVWGVLFAAIGITTLLIINAATPVTVDASLSNPRNIKAWGDDRVITVSWDEPSNKSGIVGYYVTWGTNGQYTNAKQTTDTITQIQPVNNGTVYNIKVQSAQGSYVSVPTPGAIEGNTGTEARANGKVSTGITTNATPTSARVDQLRSQMTGFFDDFNTPEGGFDELKWNHATSGCVEEGSSGAFINNQFHAHNQLRSGWCDRAQIVSRPRAVFDITGKTETNPGVIVADFDGVAHGRDVWYIDLIPVDARKDGTPLDITSHASAFDDSAGDPKMLRMVQFFDKVHFIMYDNNKQPRSIAPTYNCPDWESEVTSYEWCPIGDNPVAGMSPIPEPDLSAPSGEPNRKFPVENVRQHWTIQISGTKIKLFINSERVWEAPMPADFANVKKYTVHSTLFSYNTGKMDSENPNTSLLHWDNFGFNGPASNIVTHNYLEGGSTGTTPYLGRGTTATPVPTPPRNLKVNIPDPIGTPIKARVMFTINTFGYQYYTWKSSDHIMVNGQRYNFDNPGGNQQTPLIDEWYGPSFGESHIPYADSIEINPANLKQGINDIGLNIDTTGILNVHIELDYAKGTEPSYTQPKDIFGAAYLTAVRPAMSSHDSYVFIENNMGLPSGVISSTPTPTDTQAPTVSISSPTNGSSFTKGTSLPVVINANDNVGVERVDLVLDGSLNTTITHSPFNHTLDTTNWSNGNHTLMARAFDAAGNNTASNQITISITDPTPADTTGPTVSVTAPTSGQTITGTVAVSSNASDPSGVSSVSFYLDNGTSALATDNQSPYTFQWNSANTTNGSHTITARATDSLGNQTTSGGVTFTVNNITPDTTAPNASITFPINGATTSGTVTVSANASDNVGVSKVELIVDGNTLAPADTTSPYQFSWNTSGYAPGTHMLRVRATDAAGNSSLSNIVTVTIPDSTAPITGITAPVGGTTVSGTVNITATATDNVGVSKVDFIIDGSVVSTDTGSPYSFGWATTGVSNAVHTLQTRATDAAGNVGQSIPIVVTVNNVLTPPPTTPPTPKAGDLNNDGKVSIFDLQIMISNWRRNNASTEQGDLNGDGTVNIFDLQILINNWGR